jgi:hypothetical protein
MSLVTIAWHTIMLWMEEKVTNIMNKQSQTINKEWSFCMLQDVTQGLELDQW